MDRRLQIELAGMLLLPYAASATPCADVPRLHALDFWVGKWSVSANDERVGGNLIERILDGCAVTERWKDARGSEGRSLFYYDATLDVWKQLWVTDDALRPGGTKEKGEQKEMTAPGRMRFQGRYASQSGTPVVDRTTLTANSDGTVRQLIEVSADEGKSWRTTFDAVYRKASAQAPAPDPGIHALQSGDWTAAERIYRQRLAAAPDSAQDRINLGIALFGMGKVEASARELSIAAGQPKRGFANTPALANVWLARARVRLKDTEGALQALEGASRAGLRTTGLLKAAPDLAVLSEMPRFKKVMADVRARELPCEAAGAANRWVLSPGRWEQRDMPGQVLGHSVVEIDAGGCAVVERTENTGGYVARALHAFEPATGRWHQLYADSAGIVTSLEGRRDGKQLTYDRSDNDAPDANTRERHVWNELDTGRVAQKILRSSDGGKSWTVFWEGVYIKTGSSDDPA